MPSALLWQWRNSIEDNDFVDDSDDDLLTPNLPEIRPHAQHLLHPIPPLQPIHQSFNKLSSKITISKSVGENTKARSFCFKIWKKVVWYRILFLSCMFQVWSRTRLAARWCCTTLARTSNSTLPTRERRQSLLSDGEYHVFVFAIGALIVFTKDRKINSWYSLLAHSIFFYQI